MFSYCCHAFNSANRHFVPRTNRQINKERSKQILPTHPLSSKVRGQNEQSRQEELLLMEIIHRKAPVIVKWSENKVPCQIQSEEKKF